MRAWYFAKVMDYTKVEEDEDKTSDDFASMDVVIEKEYWLWCVNNYNLCLNTKEISEFFDKKISDLEEEISIYKSLKDRHIKEAENINIDDQWFVDIKSSIRYWDYHESKKVEDC